MTIASPMTCHAGPAPASVRAAACWPRWLCAAACAGSLLACRAGASAQGKLDARYEATLAGIPVGKGAWIIDIADDQYSAAASGGTSGLLKAFAAAPAPAPRRAASSMARWCRRPIPPPTTTSKKSEDHPDVAGQRQRQGIRHRAGAAGRSRPHPGHRRASPRRLRSDDGLAAARARHRRSAQPGRLPHRRARSSTAACATSSSSTSSAWST